MPTAGTAAIRTDKTRQVSMRDTILPDKSRLHSQETEMSPTRSRGRCPPRFPIPRGAAPMLAVLIVCFLALVPGSAANTSPCLRFADHDTINDLFSSGGAGTVVHLCASKTYHLTGPIVFTAANQELATSGYPTDASRARLLVQGTSETAIQGDCARCKGIQIRSLIVDGNRRKHGRAKPADEGAGLVVIGGTEDQLVRDNILRDPRGFSAVYVREGRKLECKGVRVEGNRFEMVGEEYDAIVDGPDPENSPLGRPLASGLSLACKDSTVTKNVFIDNTDAAVVIYGAPGSVVADNEIKAVGKSVMAGILMVDTHPYSGDYTGTVVRANTISASGRAVRVGIGAGTSVWSDDTTSILTGGSILSNKLEGERMGYGIAAAGLKGWTIKGNLDLADYEGQKGERCFPEVTNPEPMAFVYTKGLMQDCEVQSEFTDAPFQYVLCIEPVDPRNRKSRDAAKKPNRRPILQLPRKGAQVKEQAPMQVQEPGATIAGVDAKETTRGSADSDAEVVKGPIIGRGGLKRHAKPKGRPSVNDIMRDDDEEGEGDDMVVGGGTGSKWRGNRRGAKEEVEDQVVVSEEVVIPKDIDGSGSKPPPDRDDELGVDATSQSGSDSAARPVQAGEFKERDAVKREGKDAPSPTAGDGSRQEDDFRSEMDHRALDGVQARIERLTEDVKGYKGHEGKKTKKADGSKEVEGVVGHKRDEAASSNLERQLDAIVKRLDALEKGLASFKDAESSVRKGMDFWDKEVKKMNIWRREIMGTVDERLRDIVSRREPTAAGAADLKPPPFAGKKAAQEREQRDALHTAFRAAQNEMSGTWRSWVFGLGMVGILIWARRWLRERKLRRHHYKKDREDHGSPNSSSHKERSKSRERLNGLNGAGLSMTNGVNHPTVKPKSGGPGWTGWLWRANSRKEL